MKHDRFRMRQLRRNIVTRKVLLVLYVLAAVTIGFAHRPMALPQDVDLAAYAMPDGTLPVICLGVGADGNVPAKSHAGAACDACLLTCAPGLVAAGESFSIALASTPVRLGPVADVPVIDRRHSTASRPRAPPLPNAA